ncbi:MAG: lauroyl acyltransferase [Rhodospirillaceae bacterium]|jgi:KDO2-lipid IV(A) lauroyltransferase|uniref:lysophospholipid acyltransferase family protein n=1 Tax=Hwanghaeella sp. 1Z406 TaxID=3402811 RepID=UPI000C52293A|nr:lauroyl acyltransferase [Rhodospirillales bacterium]MAX48159.1 lauroyl acyltransferase [Rhodospirillaceae bacterium]|tara:strand:+ start:109343 stop:110248 length:906 start_codon:yes stop_codon:yes gene_type:complete
MLFKQAQQRRGTFRAVTYYIEYCMARAVLALLAALPRTVASAIGGRLFRLVGPFLKADKIARRNLAQAFPDWDKAKIDATVRDVWDNLGRGAGEFPHANNLNVLDPDGPIETIGLEHLWEAKRKGAFMMVSAHMANWELATTVASQHGCPMTAIYRPADNPWMDRYFRAIRSGFTGKLLPKGRSGMRDAVMTLKEGRPLALLLDQKLNEGMAVPFFGREAMTASAPIEMALRQGAPILPVRIERIEDTRFRVTIHPPLVAPDTDDRHAKVRAILVQYNTLLEAWIRERPGQWFWLHKRWPN